MYCNIGNQHSILGVTGQVRQSVRGNVGSNFANLIGTCRKYDDRPQFLKVIIGVGELTKVLDKQYFIQLGNSAHWIFRKAEFSKCWFSSKPLQKSGFYNYFG